MSEVEVLSNNNAGAQVSLDEYNSETGRAVIKAVGTGLVELNPESSQLQKIIFFGKTKDEIRRYLLSLDHVNGVEVKFSPAWMGTVPHVAEHVNVVVKKVE
jgi:predicted ATP-grasp superfamily ATP-dependent carboligase